MTPFTWGTPNLDQNLTPIMPYSFVLLYGEQGSGKTAYTIDLAIKNALSGKKVIYFTLEMTSDQLLNRIGNAYSGITPSELRLNEIPETKQKAKDRKIEEIKSISNLAIFGSDSMDCSCEQIKMAYEESGADLAIVDNFNLVKREDKENEYEADLRISKFFMEFTNKTNKPVVVIHHTNKQGKVRGSQKILDNADMVISASRNKDEDASQDERKNFSLFQVKDREFGNMVKIIVKFDRGSFVDKIQSKEISEVVNIFSK